MRVSLRLIDQQDNDDVTFLFETRRHPDVAKYLFGRPPESMEVHKRWMAMNIPSKRLIFLAIVDGQRIGYCHVYGFDKGEVEMGFVVHPDEHGKGYGAEMVSLLRDEVRRLFPMKKPFLMVKITNEKALRFYAKNGFRCVSVRMEPEDVVNEG